MKPSTRELLKSLALGIAALAGLILWLKYQPSPPADWSEKGAGEALCPGFTDADQPQSVTILRPKETDGEMALSEIRLAREKDGWVVKNAEDAPADSPDRMAAVLAPLRRLTVLSGLGEINSRTDEAAVLEFHRSCRLLDPADAAQADLAHAGVRLTVSGREGETFADLIIGDVPEGSARERDIRYVRPAGEDAVFTADFSGESLGESGQEKALPYLDRLSTDPIDWMNRDLLRVSRWNIARMTLYEIAIDSSGTILRHRALTAAQDPEKSLGRVWELVRLITFDADGKPAETEINDGNRETDNASLNEQAEQITHLRFGRLVRLPAELAGPAAAGRPMSEWTEHAGLLAPMGFQFDDHDPADPDSVEPFLLGAEGTASLSMKGGLRLTVLFGRETSAGQAVLVIPSLDEELLAKPEPIPVPDGADEAQIRQISDENRLRESEYALSRGEAESALQQARHRFGGWVFFLDGE